MDYANMPRSIGAVVSHGKATLHECQTVYGLEDVYLLLEVINVDGYNQKVMNTWRQ